MTRGQESLTYADSYDERAGRYCARRSIQVTEDSRSLKFEDTGFETE